MKKELLKKILAGIMAVMVLVSSGVPANVANAENTTVEMTKAKEPSVEEPSIELYTENDQVLGVKITNNMEAGNGYVYIKMYSDTLNDSLWSEEMAAQESRIVLFEEFDIWNPESGVYQLGAYTFDLAEGFDSPTVFLNYTITIDETDYNGDSIEIFWEYEREGREFCCYIPVNQLPNSAKMLSASYSSNDDEWIGELYTYKSLDGSHWIFQDHYDKNWGLTVTGLKYCYNTAVNTQGVTFTVVNVPQESVQITERAASQKNIAILDYDYYMSFIASGGAIIYDDANGSLSAVTDEFKNQKDVWSLEGFVETLTGTEIYRLVKQIGEYILEAANLYWHTKEGDYVATVFYDTKGNEISEKSISEYEIVLAKYEPEIVWVDSMELTAPKTMKYNETGVVEVSLDAGQDKYPFKATPQVRFKSSNPAIVSVDAETGALRAGTVNGKATITAYADEDLRASEGLEEIVTASVEIEVGDKEEVVPKDPVTEAFKDIAPGNWYVDAVQFVYDNGIMSGSQGVFNPTKNITREQVIATLYNLEGSPKVSNYAAVNALKDVKSGQWYTDAVCWAYNTGVASGNSSTKLFGIGNSITRQQLAMMLYNYAGSKGYDTATRGDYSSLEGANKVESYAKEAMQWAYGMGLISGSKTNVNGIVVYHLNPGGNATRAQMASILMNFVQKNGL